MNVKFNYNPDTRLSIILLLTTVTIFLWYKFAPFPSADDRLNTVSDYLSPRQSSSSKIWIFSKCICVERFWNRVIAVRIVPKVGLFASSYGQLNLTNVYVILFCLYLKDKFVRLDIFVLFHSLNLVLLLVQEWPLWIIYLLEAKGLEVLECVNSQNKKRAK